MATVDGEHKRASAATLSDLTAGVRETLHEDTDAVSGLGSIGSVHAAWSNCGDVHSDTSTPLHDLHLLLVSKQDSAIRVIGLLDHKAV